MNPTLAEIRREYGELHLNESEISSDPFLQFKAWFEQIIKTETCDPTAMVLSTVDEQGFPDSRVVLLKAIDADNFVFYTNYQSAKAKQLENKPYACLNFYWPQFARQVRIRGTVEKTSSEQSDEYFASRPLTSQLSAIASHQSQAIENRAVLEAKLIKLIEQNSKNTVPRPAFWGGYALSPEFFEFWQGRDNRLHDRIRYFKENEKWMHERLAP